MLSQTLRVFLPSVDLPFSPLQTSVQKQKAKVLTTRTRFMSCKDQARAEDEGAEALHQLWGRGMHQEQTSPGSGSPRAQSLQLCCLWRDVAVAGRTGSRDKGRLLALLSSGASCPLIQPSAWLPTPSLQLASHLRLLQLQKLQELILLVVVLGTGIREDVDEGPRVGNLHSSLDSPHTHLRAVTTSLQG